MTTAAPWSVKGIDPKARELAKDLARRSGMTLGEWLNQMITEGEGEVEDDAPPTAASRAGAREIRLSSDAELRRVARALDALTARMEAAEHRSTLAISGIDQSVMGVLSRVEAVERDRNAVAARFDAELDEVRAAQAKVSDRLRRMSDDDAPRLEAMRALEGALGKIAEKIYDSETKARAALDDVRQDVAHAVRRVDRVESRIEAEPAAHLVEAVTAKLGDRLAEAEARTSAALQALEASFAGLDARLKTSEAAAEEDAAGRRFERLAAELSDKVEGQRAEFAERLNAIAEGKFDRMEATLKELTGQVEQGERRSAQAIDRMGREVMRIAQTLGDRVSTVEARSAEAAQQMGGEMARIAEAMESRMAHADQVQAAALEKLGGEISRIAERLADRIANAERRSAQAIDDVGEQVGRVTERLNDRYDASQNALAERIRASEERTAKLLEEARETIDRRLLEAQRRNALEDVALAARRAAEEEARAPARRAPAALFDDDPFAEPIERAVPAAAPSPFEEPPFAEPSFSQPGDLYGDFAADGVEAEAFAPPPAPVEPRSTRDVVAAARAAARMASEKSEARARRESAAATAAPDLAGSVAAPALEVDGPSRFSIGLPKRKKKDAFNLRTMVMASGTAAALAVTAVGATLYMGAEANHGDHIDHTGPAPTAARAEEPKAAPVEAAAATEGTGVALPTDAKDAGKSETLAVAIAPPPGETAGLAPPAKTAPAKPAPKAAPSSTEVRPLYNTAIGRLQSGDVAGVEDLKKAANLGFAPAQFYLAKLYESGGSGVKKDLAEARRWTQRAAEAGDARAMHNLALYEFNGEGGAKDAADATRWFKKAAAQGVVDSQYNLGRIYETGMRDGAGAEAVPQNKAEAYKWYLLAAAHGDKGAKASAEAIKAQLPADQAAAAERSAQAFRAETPTAVTAQAQ